MNPTPYIFFNGNCAEALEAYAEIFGTEIEVKLPASDMPPEYSVPDTQKHQIMHASMRIGDGELMASDNLFGEATTMSGCSVMVSVPTKEEAEVMFSRLAEGGEVRMPFAPTFWSAGFGTLTDRFGISWMIGCDEPPAGAEA